jgi:DUF2934 family protein
MAKDTTKPREVVTAGNRPPRRGSRPPTIPDSEIARRAYDLYLARGCENGYDVQDWLQAERELNGSTRAR